MRKGVLLLSAGMTGFLATLLPTGTFALESGHDDAHGAAHEAASSGLPQLDISTFPSQLFWLAATFAVLYFIFSKKSLPEISSVLENRREHIQSDLETAESLRTQAEQAQDTYESGLNNARKESSKTLHDAQDSIRIKAEKQTELFREKTEKEILLLEKRLTDAKDRAMEDMSMIAAEVASEAAMKIVGINPDIEQAKTVVRSINDMDAKAA